MTRSVLLASVVALAAGAPLSGCNPRAVYSQRVLFCNDTPDSLEVEMVDGNNPRRGETVSSGDCAIVGVLHGRGSSGAVRIVRPGSKPRLIAVQITDPITEETTVSYGGEPKR